MKKMVLVVHPDFPLSGDYRNADQFAQRIGDALRTALEEFRNISGLSLIGLLARHHNQLELAAPQRRFNWLDGLINPPPPPWNAYGAVICDGRPQAELVAISQSYAGCQIVIGGGFRSLCIREVTEHLINLGMDVKVHSALVQPDPDWYLSGACGGLAIGSWNDSAELTPRVPWEIPPSLVF